MSAKYKVEGSGNRWYVWRWGAEGEFWSIISKAYLTKRAATAAMKRESKSNAARYQSELQGGARTATWTVDHPAKSVLLKWGNVYEN